MDFFDFLELDGKESKELSKDDKDILTAILEEEIACYFR